MVLTSIHTHKENYLKNLYQWYLTTLKVFGTRTGKCWRESYGMSAAYGGHVPESNYSENSLETL